jgi:hypothetical protein
MADSVRVQFSASIGALIKGVEDAKSAINSVRESTDRVTEGAKSLLETFGVAFSVDRIAEFVGKMAEMGEQIERSSAMLGTSTKGMQELGFIAKVTGGDAEGLALSMEHLQVNLQRAQSGTGPAAEALKALGLSAKTLSTLPLDQQLNKIADAVSRFADGGNKTAIVMELLGRGGAQMIPVLNEGSAGLDRLRKSADDTGAVMSKDTVIALDKLEQSLVGLKAAISGTAGTIVGEFAPALTESTSDLTKLIGSVNTAIQTHTVWEREIIAVKTGLLELTQAFANLGAIAKAALTLKWGDVDANWDKLAAARQEGLDKVAAIQKEGDDKINAIAQQAAIDLQKILAGTESGSFKPPPPSSGGPNKDALSAQMEQYQNQIKLADEAYKQTQEKLNSEVKLHQITYDQETQALIAALAARHDAEDAAANAEMALYAAGTAGYEKALAERKLLDAKYALDHQKIIDQQLEHDAQEWQKALTPIEGAFNSQLRGLLSGTETWAQAMKKVFSSLVLDAIGELGKLAVEKASLGLASALGGPTSLLGGGGQAVATTANTTALTALTVAVTANTAAVGGSAIAGGAKAGADLLGDAGGLSSVFSVLKPLLALFGFEQGAWEIPKLDTGSYSIPGIMPALLHPGEMVVPEPFASSLRGAVGGGGGGSGDVHFHVSAIDASSIQKFFQQNGNQIARSLQSRNAVTPSASW